MSDLTEWLCTECGRKHEFATDPDSQKVCNDCGAFLKRATEVPLTADSVLRELIEKWRSDEYRHDPGFHAAADQLEQVIGE